MSESRVARLMRAAALQGRRKGRRPPQAMSPQMTAQLVMDALLMAVWRRGWPTEPRQYTSEDFQRLLSAQGIVCSVSRRGDCWDNSAMESFFSSLKTERVSRSHYATYETARADIFDYIERFYNPKRRHSTLGQISPIEFERRQLR